MRWTYDDPAESEASVGTRRIAIGEGNCKGVEASRRQGPRAVGLKDMRRKGELVPTGCWSCVSVEGILKADVEAGESGETGTERETRNES
jgi:hypothetical protein